MVGSKTDASRVALEERKDVLLKKRKERDEMIECDKITKKIRQRGKSRSELDRWVH